MQFKAVLIWEKGLQNIAKRVLWFTSDIMGQYKVIPPDLEEDPYGGDSYQVLLYWRVIGLVAFRLQPKMEFPKFDIRNLVLIVLVHEIAHYITHRGKDLTGGMWRNEEFRKSDTFIKESFAQFLTYFDCYESHQELRYFTDSLSLLGTFRALLQHQSGVYSAFVREFHPQQISIEFFRSLLIHHREGYTDGKYGPMFEFLERYYWKPTPEEFHQTEIYFNMLTQSISEPDYISPTKERSKRMVKIRAPEPLKCESWNKVRIEIPTSGLRVPSNDRKDLGDGLERITTGILPALQGRILVQVKTGGHFRTNWGGDEIELDLLETELLEADLEIYPLKTGKFNLIFNVYQIYNEDEIPQIMTEIRTKLVVSESGGKINLLKNTTLTGEGIYKKLKLEDVDWNVFGEKNIFSDVEMIPEELHRQIEFCPQTVLVTFRTYLELLINFLYKINQGPSEIPKGNRFVTPNFYFKLKFMEDLGVISVMNSVNINYIRGAGNKAAHEIIPKDDILNNLQRLVDSFINALKEIELIIC